MAQKKAPPPPRARPDRLTRVVVLVWVVAGAAVLTTLFRAARALGLFSFLSTVSPVCQSVAVPAAPADLAYEYKSRTLFIAASADGVPGKADGLYALTPGGGKPVKLAGTPPDFHPGAVSVGYDAGGAPVLMTVNHHQNGAVSVEIYNVSFDASGPILAYQSSVEGALAKRGQGVASLGNARFYLAANPTSSDFMAWADRNLLLARADILFFNGTVFREAVNGLSDPSAVAVSLDGTRVYVASRGERRLLAFSREPVSGGLTELDSISVPMRPERISIDATGTVWVAGPARLPALSTTSVVARVFVGADGKPLSVDTVYATDGIKAATAAAKVDNHLFIGSSRDDKLLDCAVK